jgi:hypothetical protein
MSVAALAEALRDVPLSAGRAGEALTRHVPSGAGGAVLWRTTKRVGTRVVPGVE